jgi:mRNA interferase HicA
MKRKELINHSRSHDCKLLREGGNHSWWYNPKLNKRSSVQRHKEIVDFLAIKICKDLGFPKID